MPLGTKRNYKVVGKKLLGFVLVYKLTCTVWHGSDSFVKCVTRFCVKIRLLIASSFWRCWLYINGSLKYTVIEKVSDEAFLSLWIEIQLPQKSNIICGIIYRQHKSPKRFQEYFDDKLERLITSNKSIYIMGDFNINLLHAETSCYA